MLMDSEIPSPSGGLRRTLEDFVPNQDIFETVCWKYLYLHLGDDYMGVCICKKIIGLLSQKVCILLI